MSEILAPKQLSDLGTEEFNKGNFEAAAHSFAAAAEGFSAANSPLDVAEQRNNQCVALLQNGNPKEALAVVKGTADVFAEAGDERRQGIALGNEGTALDALGDWKEAAQKYFESAVLLEHAGEGQMRSQVLNSLAILQTKHAELADAYISILDGYAGVKDPSLKQKIIKKILRFRPPV
jgi:tetratricopeptide (TPR) repeat protein